MKDNGFSVGDFKKWLKENKVPDEARIILQHPGGYDDFVPDEYDPTHKVVVAMGTG